MCEEKERFNSWLVGSVPWSVYVHAVIVCMSAHKHCKLFSPPGGSGIIVGEKWPRIDSRFLSGSLGHHHQIALVIKLEVCRTRKKERKMACTESIERHRRQELKTGKCCIALSLHGLTCVLVCMI